MVLTFNSQYDEITNKYYSNNAVPYRIAFRATPQGTYKQRRRRPNSAFAVIEIGNTYFPVH
jgi:hypothetical protein